MDDYALRLQARMQRATLDEPRVGSLPAALAGLTVAVGALVAISYAGGHAAQCWQLLAAITRATTIVLGG